MDSFRFAMPFLESLATSELLELADRYGLDIPPNLERNFIIEELIELERDGGEETAAPAAASAEETKIRARHGFKGTVALPKQYNISFIEVFVRDPLWVFAFWEIKDQDREFHQKTAGFKGYCLRVMPLGEDGSQVAGADSFTVAVSASDRAWYLGIPSDSGRCFKVELCALWEEGGVVLVSSRPFRLPQPIEPTSAQEMQAVYQNPLALLSGVERFSLARSVDRLQRLKDCLPKGA